jgi:hypothetical protein
MEVNLMRQRNRRLTWGPIAPALLLSLAMAGTVAASNTPFAGLWQGTDPGDGSRLEAQISGAVGVQIVYTDDDATTACAESATPEFASVLTGRVEGTELFSTMRVAKCGNVNIMLLGLEITWTLLDQGNADPSDDVLVNSFGEEFVRAD